MRPFRFGINVRTAASQAEWADKARKVEALGYAVLLVPDHLADLLAPFPGLAAREADIIGLTGIAFRQGGREPDVAGFRAASVDECVRLVGEAAADRFDRFELNALVQRVVVTDDRRKAAEELATGRWARLTPDEILASPYAP